MAADEDVLAIALRDLILANISGFTLIPDQPFPSFLAFLASPIPSPFTPATQGSAERNANMKVKSKRIYKSGKISRPYVFRLLNSFTSGNCSFLL